jgi:beta-phosphoglucomutase family hydrolase
MSANLGLPEAITACLFDLDGVITKTAKVHAKAWAEMFDDFLERRAKESGEEFRPFTDDDYERYVDGLPRLEGVRSFLQSRGIELPEGSSGDAADELTMQGLGTRKNDLVLELIRRDGVEAFEGSVRYLEAVRKEGLRTAVVSSSTNCKDVLEAAGIEDFFEVRVDGVVAEEEGLAGKPAPDTFLAGAAKLGVEAAQAAVFEDALAGVDAGRAGDFGLVVGVDRGDEADELREHGADVVVKDLAELMGSA